jgi:DNA-binding NarL/FixJ family response regulator
VLVLTVHEDYSYIEKLMILGASGYVLKRAARNELIEAVRAVAAGDTYIDRHVAGAVVKTLVHEQRFGPSSSESSLTPRELSVAKHIARGYTNKEIAANLNLSVKTIETHKANCMQKLGLRSRAELVRYACDHGWLVQAPEGPQGLP